MGLFDKLFTKQAQEKRLVGEYFETLTAYSPVFTTYEGGLYEMELTRAAIHSFASSCSKLTPEIQGKAYKNLEKTLQFRPNPWMDTSKFIYRLATILSVNTTAFIIPLYGKDYETIVGYYPLLPQRTEMIDVNGEPWLRYSFSNGKRASIELSRVGVLTNYQYKDDFFGDGNSSLMPTLKLLDTQRQGIEEGIKQSAVLRFMAKLGQTLRPEDITKERERFSQDNLSSDNKSGVLMFDQKYSEVKQIDSKPFIIDAEQMKLIHTNVYNYFGVNESILQNSYTEDQWNAWYEGKIEPFALQLSLVMSNMTFTSNELSFGNSIIFTANRLQYASNNTKLQVSTQLFDRGILTTNQVMDIWNMAHVEDGDKRFIRREYTEVNKLDYDKGGENIADSKEQGISESTNPATTDTGEEN
ncbi:phage portal protein [Heyndrickxia sp. FSL K6-6286]|uniref:phage portal protein n=1 Tax=Heyndrickxia sp. FSL K6-6286 TaxID=2921510 RepID=UPI00315A1DEE